MHLDVLTLIFAGSFVALISAVVLTGAWLNMARPHALKWWAAFMYVYSAGVASIALGVAAEWPAAIFEANLLFLTASALMWLGARAFERRTLPVVPLTAALLVWSIVDTLLILAGSGSVALLPGFGLSLLLIMATQVDLWRGRAEGLPARWALIGLLGLHVVILTAGAYDTIQPHAPLTAGPQLNSVFGLVNFEGLIFAVGAPILMVTLCRERLTLDYEHAAQIDPLTGIANRRALFAGADRLFARCQTSGAPLSVIEFDLDRFKVINDTHGHAAGDMVLRAFVIATRGVLRQNDLLGRHGGEEFAAILPGTNVEAAYIIAERARHAFAEVAHESGERTFFATVSAGVAAMQPGENFGDVLDKADRALYRAKGRGRNRVERAEDGQPRDQTIIRVA